MEKKSLEKTLDAVVSVASEYNELRDICQNLLFLEVRVTSRNVNSILEVMEQMQLPVVVLCEPEVSL